MQCLRSGYCCIHYDVMIVNNPELGPVENNVIHKPSGVKCQHLIGERVGQYSCTVHHYEWYTTTPCYEHSQIGNHNSPCRMGHYILNRNDR